jgi:hypothetical protein
MSLLLCNPNQEQEGLYTLNSSKRLFQNKISSQDMYIKITVTMRAFVKLTTNNIVAYGQFPHWQKEFNYFFSKNEFV